LGNAQGLQREKNIMSANGAFHAGRVECVV
jgi:hypothetical protein